MKGSLKDIPLNHSPKIDLMNVRESLRTTLTGIAFLSLYGAVGGGVGYALGNALQGSETAMTGAVMGMFLGVASGDKFFSEARQIEVKSQTEIPTYAPFLFAKDVRGATSDSASLISKVR